MPSIKLSDIQAAADKKYGDFVVELPDNEIVSFAPALRLPKVQRRLLAAALDIQKRAEADDDADIYDVYRDVFRISARQGQAFDKLTEAIGDDPAIWEELANEFLQDTQAGEA